MIAPTSETSLIAEHQKFCLRAAQLQLNCWSVDLSYNLAASSTNNVECQCADQLITAAREMRSNNVTSVVHRYTDSEYLAMSDEHGTLFVALPSAPSVVNRNQLIQILKTFHSDINQASENAKMIDGFNAQLSQSYEEVNLIFRMSKFLAGSNDPRTAVQSMCDELRSVLNYGWVAVSFAQSASVIDGLNGAMIHSGQLPCTGTELRTHSSTLASTSVGKVLVPAGNALAACAGAEVLTKRLLHGKEEIGIVLTGNRHGVDPDISSNEIQLVDATTGFLELFHQNAFRFAEQKRQFFGTLHALSAAVDAKDPYTHGHSARVGLLGSQLAAKLGWDAELVEATRVAGLLHDIGKIGIPEAILTKPSRLTDEEFEIIKRHPVIGYNILRQLPTLTFHLPGVLHHHERWDGNGYPEKLRGEQIPMVARILAFADTFDAMSSNRAYRNALSRTRVLEELRKSAGTQFDPELVEAFVTLDFTEFDARLSASTSLHAANSK